MCDFTHLLSSITHNSKQDAMDTDCPDSCNFLVRENTKNPESVARNGNTLIPSNSIEPDDGYEMDREKDHVNRTNIIW